MNWRIELIDELTPISESINFYNRSHWQDVLWNLCRQIHTRCGRWNWRDDTRSQTHLAMSSVTFMRPWRIKWAPWGCIIVTLNPVYSLVKVFDDFAGVLPVQHERVTCYKVRKEVPPSPLCVPLTVTEKGLAFIYLFVSNLLIVIFKNYYVGNIITFCALRVMIRLSYV